MVYFQSPISSHGRLTATACVTYTSTEVVFVWKNRALERPSKVNRVIASHWNQQVLNTWTSINCLPHKIHFKPNVFTNAKLGLQTTETNVKWLILYHKLGPALFSFG